MGSRIAAVLTCHNRRSQTLACLRSLQAQASERARLDAYVVDDGSTDGTSAAVQEEFPEATVLRGDGSLFWNRGMAVGLERAAQNDYDFYLWVNDDTRLDNDAVSILLDTAEWVTAHRDAPAIVVGSTRDPETGVLTYGGRARPPGIRRTRFERVQPGDTPRQTETMNGNISLVPRSVTARIGHIDPHFHHKWGDEDYGLRARTAGCELWLTPGTIGECARNTPVVYGGGDVRREWRRLTSIKEFHPADWATFTRRWAGPAWPLFFVSPYLRNGLRIAAGPLRRRT